MTAVQIADKFYNAFSNHNSSEMINLYHEDVIFSDPAFGILKGDRAKKMWDMLLSNDQSNLTIQYQIIESSDHDATIKWIAKYRFGPSKRSVVNHVTARLKIDKGKIVEHQDSFNLWKWSKQALGISGLLLGWTSFMRNKIQQKTNHTLDKFINQLSNLT